MAVVTLTTEFATSVPASRMFKAAILDSHNLSPKLLPFVKSIEFIEGNHITVGSISKTNFVEGGAVSYVKFKSEAIDTENYYLKYVAFEGGHIGEKLEFVAYEVKFEATSEGSVCKTTTHYHAKAGCELDKEEVKGWNEQTMVFYKLVSDHLIANPHLYC